MSLTSGTRLGHYEVLAPLGEGGMGKVYRARDSRLGREVAIKVLHDDVSRDQERLARFEREAHLLASLNHPQIATIHGFEESNGLLFLVMELVEGETLAERLARGPLSLGEALPLFQHVAHGLEAAHEKGIVHRDLKPSNIKIAPDGKPKILDFGLAKALAPSDGEAVVRDLSQSPTLTRDATETGVLLGTAPYMSPEQARGKSVDKKTDIWAFGCCLYEALAGRPAFRGETVSDTLARILEREPDWEALPATTPGMVRNLLRRTLQRDSTRRLHDIADARIELEEAESEPQKERPLVAEHRQRRWAIPALVVGVLLIGASAGWLLRLPAPSEPQPVTRLRMTVLPAEKLDNPARGVGSLSRTAMVFSPDGTNLVYAGAEGGVSRLYLRPMDEPEARPIPGTEGGRAPFFSPDGRWVGFWADGKLMKVSLEGTPPSTLCETTAPFGASWGERGGIVFSRSSASGLLRVPAEGGEPKSLTDLDTESGEIGHGLPHFLPGGEELLFTVRKAGGWKAREIQILSLRSGERKVLVENAADGRYAPTGHLVFVRLGVLMAVSFDIKRHEVVGGAVDLIDGVNQAVNANNSEAETGAAQFALSSTGSLAYVPGGIRPDPRFTLVWVDRAGNEEPLKMAPGRIWTPRISPDGARVAVSIRKEGNEDLWLYDLSRATLTRLTSGETVESWPLWTPDGSRITFASDRGIFWVPWDGSGEPEPLTTAERGTPSSWTPDGTTLALAFGHSGDVWLAPREGNPEPLLQSPFLERWPAFSPDGRWLAYVSDETGRDEVYVQPYPGPGARVSISSEGGAGPAWTRNGTELVYYTVPDSDGLIGMMAVDIVTAPELRASTPRLLFRGNYRVATPVRNYDVTPDGQRFLMARSEGVRLVDEVTELQIVLNWHEELKRLVPADR